MFRTLQGHPGIPSSASLSLAVCGARPSAVLFSISPPRDNFRTVFAPTGIPKISGSSYVLSLLSPGRNAGGVPKEYLLKNHDAVGYGTRNHRTDTRMRLDTGYSTMHSGKYTSMWFLMETLLLMGNAWQVCRRLKDIIDESLLLKYHTEMQSCGMTTAPEGPSTRNLTLQERYTKLLLFDATWRSLAWRKHEVLQMQNSTALWDLYGGVLATGTPIDGNRDDWRLEFRELDSMGRRGQELEISHWGFQVELPLVEIAMDPTQNLLVLLTV